MKLINRISNIMLVAALRAKQTKQLIGDILLFAKSKEFKNAIRLHNHVIKEGRIEYSKHKFTQVGVGYAARLCCLNCGASIEKSSGPCHLVAGNVGIVIGANLYKNT